MWSSLLPEDLNRQTVPYGCVPTMAHMTELDLRCYFVTGAGAPDQIVETARAAAQGGS